MLAAQWFFFSVVIILGMRLGIEWFLAHRKHNRITKFLRWRQRAKPF